MRAKEGAIAMRDTDLGWMTKIIACVGGPIASIANLKNRTLALGSRDSGHAAMSYDNPAHREILHAEGLKRWLTPHLDGYAE
jgi:hypothetical protein